MTTWAVDEADLIEPDRLAASVLDDVINERRKPVAQRRRLAPIEALTALEYEAHFVMVAAENLSHGIDLHDGDRKRLAEAWRRVNTLLKEVRPCVR